MIDHAAHVESVIKDEAASQASSHLLPKDKVGFSVQQMFVPHPDLGLAPAWFVTITIKSHLLGSPPVGNGAPIYGLLPSDEDLRTAVRLLTDKNQTEWLKEIEAPQ